MTETEKNALEELGRRCLPAWEELPDLALYMDQVLSLTARYLPGGEDRALTAAMVNNYVKQKVLPPPVGKRYGRSHISALLMLCSLKSIMPIADIQRLFQSAGGEEGIRALYGEFRGIYGQANQMVAQQLTAVMPEGRSRFLFAALGARAAQELAAALLPRPEEGQGRMKARSGRNDSTL